MRAAEIDFDEEWYLRQYPDVADGIRNGAQKSAIHHYLEYGIKEGRQPRAPITINSEWYARSYPLAVDEVGGKEPADLQRHYDTIGRFRGYLPYRSASTPKNAAAINSAFGGLWIDNANALDLIAGRYELGLITKSEAELLATFHRQGYVVMKSALPPVAVDRAAQALEDAYDGKIPGLLFECHAQSLKYIPADPKMKEVPAKALDIHWHSEPIRDAGFDANVLRLLHLLFERPVMASQSLGFYIGSGQPMHQDSAYVPYSIPQQYAAAWIALEDVKVGGGELMYFPTSHRTFKEFSYDEKYKSASDAKRMGMDPRTVAQQEEHHLSELEAQAHRLGLPREKFIAQRGDVLIWHSDLAHGGSHVSKGITRKSLVFHYSPKEIVPLFMENGGRQIKKYNNGAYYTSDLYGLQSS